LPLDDFISIADKKFVAQYTKLVEKEWDSVPVVKPGEAPGSRYGEHFIITHMAEELAKQRGDADALISIKARNLSDAYAYYEIAEALQQAGRDDEALGWAERGLAAYADEHNAVLIDFIVTAYHQQKRFQDAVDLLWRSFTKHPTMGDFRALKDSAKKAKCWPERYAEIKRLFLAELNKPDVGKAATTGYLQSIPKYSLRSYLEILLEEKDLDEAIALVDKKGCPYFFANTLAKACEPTHPQAAIRFYKHQVEEYVDRRNNNAYAQAANIVKTIGGIYKKIKQKNQFNDYLAELRVKHKPKRNFMRELEGV